MSVNGVGSMSSVWQLYNRDISSTQASDETSSTSKKQDSYAISAEAIQEWLEASGQSALSLGESSTDTYSPSDFGSKARSGMAPPPSPPPSDLSTEDKKSFLTDLLSELTDNASSESDSTDAADGEDNLSSLIASLSSADLDSLSDGDVDSLFQQAIETIGPAETNKPMGPPPGPPPGSSSSSDEQEDELAEEIQRYLESLKSQLGTGTDL